MINYNTLGRTHRIIQKCAEGSSVQPASDKTKQEYARKNGLVYQNRQFFKLDASGNPTNTTVDVPDSVLQNFQTEKAAGTAAILSQVNQGLDIASAALFSSNPRLTNQAPETQMLDGAYDMATNVVSKVNPMVGTIMKVGGFASDAMHAAGIGTDQQTGFDKFADSKIGMLTGIGMVNGIGASKTQDFSADTDTIEKVGSSYGGTVAGIEEAADKAGKKYGLFSSGAKKRANNYINEMRRSQNIMAGIASEATDQRELVDMMGDVASQAYSSQISGGFDARYFRAEEGGKIPEEFEPELLDIEPIIPCSFAVGGVFEEIINPTTGQIEPWTPELIDIDVDKFKEGGKVEEQLDAPEIEETEQKNIIPEGALHKNKHHMDNAENLTKKGIPVVDDEHKQQAEIEKNEIIFTKEVTKKLEELYKIFYSEDSTNKEKEEAAINAGKLLTKEIMLNTDDRTGLIDTLQTGGSVNLKKPEYKEWLATVNPDFISEYYDLETAFKHLPFEALERWRKEGLKETQSEGDEWHLPSVTQIDDDTIIFLKKGKTAKDNPELQGEFDFYTSTPDFAKEWKMQYNKDEDRWYYRKRTHPNSKN